MEMKKELVFVPAPAYGHLVPASKLAKKFFDRAHGRGLSVTILSIKLPFAPRTHSYIDSIASTLPEIRFIDLPTPTLPPLDKVALETSVSLFIEAYKPSVKQTLTQLISSESTHLVGLVFDIFFTTLIDVGNELGVPTYLNFTSTAAMLGFMLHLPTLHAEIPGEFNDSTTELKISSLANSVPPEVLPSTVLNKQDDGCKWYVHHGRRFRETKGIMVNTFYELESYALDSLADCRTPPVYPVGPLLDADGQMQFQGDSVEQEKILKWLDDQPESSVVVLCFGSNGVFNEEQVKEIALGLERSGYRFLWSLRNPRKVGADRPVMANEPREGLPEGFEERVEGRGMICEWLPQVKVLGHRSTGGFVTHCGWNSVLESLWYGVPTATWPLWAEQQMNAFEMVKELGLAVDIKMSYRMGGSGEVVKAEEVERGVRSLMEGGSEVRKRVAEMKDKCRNAVKEGGSSFVSFERLIEAVLKE